MAKPTNIVKKHVLTEDEKKQQSLDHLTDELTKNEEAIKKMIVLVQELHDSGILEAAESMLKAKAKIAEVVLAQASRKEVTNMVNNVMGAGSVLAGMDPEQTKKILENAVGGIIEAKEKQGQKVSMFDLFRALKDPDINRAVGFGLHFLKGLGKGLKE